MSSEAGFDAPAAVPSFEEESEVKNGEFYAAPTIAVEETVTTMKNTSNGDAVATSNNATISEKNEIANEGLNFLYDDGSSDEETMITIGDIKQNLPFQKPSATSVGGKLDLDGQPTINGTLIYDLDLASMEEKPWQKPGADLTDYFNYGFNEETWNLYCERQRKFRAEFGTQKDINRAILSGINISFPLSQPTNPMSSNQGGRQLVNVVGPEKPQKVGGNFMFDDINKPPPVMDSYKTTTSVRTVITGGSLTPQTSIQDINSPVPSSGVESNVIPVLNFSKPPPNLLQSFNLSPTSSSSLNNGGGLHHAGDGPPGVEEAGAIPQFDISVPPPNFNPNIPPPGIGLGQRSNIPPTNMAVPPPLFGQQVPMYASAGFSQPAAPFNNLGHVPPLMGREFRRRGSSDESDDEHSRRKRRRRSRSISPRRRRDDRVRDYRGSSRHERRRDDHELKRSRDRGDYEEEKYEREKKRQKPERDRERSGRRFEASPEAKAPPGIDPE